MVCVSKIMSKLNFRWFLVWHSRVKSLIRLLITFNLFKAVMQESEAAMSGMTSKGVGVNLQTHKRILDGPFCKGDVHEGCVFMEEMRV
jgi:hypothetical protein